MKNNTARTTLGLSIPHGKQKIRFSLPQKHIIKVLHPVRMGEIKNLPKEIIKSIEKPIGSKPFKKLIKPSDKIALVIPDKTRTFPTSIVLKTIADYLNKLGIEDKNMFIVFANGTHKGQSPKEQKEMLGPEIAKRIKYFDHDAADKKNLKFIGKTSRGTKLYINKKVAEADKTILFGNITYHYFAGFSGGRKLILPGISSFESVQKNHKNVLSQFEKGICKIKAGLLKNNPVHEDMLEAAKMAKPTFIFNVVLNEKKNTSAIFAGDLEKAHAKGCSYVDKHYKVKIKKKADLVIASAGGHPKDIDYVQAHKPMEHASYALKEGGVMIFLADAPLTFPRQEYSDYFVLGDSNKIKKSLLQKFTIAGHSCFRCRNKAERFKIIWVSKHMKMHLPFMNIIHAKDMKEAIKIANKHLPANYKSYIIPDAFFAMPEVS